MQHLHSAIPMVLSPVDSSQSVLNVPFLPKFYQSVKSFHPAHTKAVNALTAQGKRVFATQFFRHKLFGLFSLFVPTALMLSAALHFSGLPQALSKASFTPANETTPLVTPTLRHILAKKTLTIATTQGDSTYFGNDGFEHGFGYDVMNNYAHKLGVTLNTVIVANDEQALAAVNRGEADMVLTAMPHAANDEHMSVVNVSCQQDFLSEHGLSRDTAVILPNTDKALVDNAQQYFCDHNVMATHHQLAAFYTTHVFDSQYSRDKFAKTLATQLPNYRTSFVKSAKQHQLDWQLLVAMGYQESQLRPDAISPTGVRGIMMLTNAAAEEMGVDDRIDPAQSIQGGAKLLNQITQQFNDIPQSDRIWFTLASYNMGPQAVRAIQDKLRAQGRNANSWAEVYRYLAQHAKENSRYVQCMQYVTHIRGYLEALKLNNYHSADVQITTKVA